MVVKEINPSGVNWIDVRVGDAFNLGGKTYVITVNGPVQLQLADSVAKGHLVLDPKHTTTIDNTFLEELRDL